MKKGMIKVSVLYPNGKGRKFDMDYYCDKHLPMVLAALGDAVKSGSVEKGIAGGAPDAPAVFITMAHLYFETIEDFQKSFGPNAEKIMGDLPNFTDADPVVQISEVLI